MLFIRSSELCGGQVEEGGVVDFCFSEDRGEHEVYSKCQEAENPETQYHRDWNLTRSNCYGCTCCLRGLGQGKGELTCS